MGAFVWLSGPGATSVAEGAGADWTRVRLAADTLLCLRGPRVPTLHRLAPGAILLGDVLIEAQPATPMALARLTAGSPGALALCARLTRQAWGRYVCVLEALSEADAPLTLFRDPSGALDCLTWRRGPLRVVASQIPGWLAPHAPEDLSIDWAIVAGWLVQPGEAAGALALRGMSAPAPGEALVLGPGAPARTLIWSPAHLARPADPTAPDPAHRLAAAVDQAVRGLAHLDGPLLAEVSGGLDSSLVAASLRACDAPVASWLNYRSARGEGDERVFARALADRLAIGLDEATKPEFALDLDVLTSVAGGARPALNGLDLVRDQDVADRAQAAGAAAIMTGQGGDMAFFQAATPGLAVDHLRNAGPLGLASPYLLDLSRWLEQPVWSLALSAARDAWLGTAPQPLHRRTAVAPGAVVRVPHGWLLDLDGLGPAKASHIASLAHKQAIYGETLRSRRVEVLHPLLSQPVLEAVLPLTTRVLTEGGIDRALARRAFADRLPAMIAARRSKGELMAYYGRMVAASLPALRCLLLDGRLTEAGLLERAALEAMLTPRHLLWRGDFAWIMTLAAIEAWAAHWSSASRR